MRPVLARVRRAVARDLTVLSAIEVLAGERFREVGMPEVAQDAPPEPEVYQRALAEGRLWVAELRGDVVGYAMARDLDGQAHLEQVSVVPEAGGHGVGAALVAAAGEWARTRGAGSLTLSTFRDVAWNAPWYERLGFRVVEADGDARFEALRREERAHGLDVDARVVMRLEL